MSFQNFPLNETLLANIAAMGFTSPTQIQSDIMPLALDGKDVSGLSRTGTGKTAAFLIPTLHRLASLPPDRLALCLAPTRELAQQIMEEANKLGKGLGFGAVSIVGGMSPEDQVAALRNGARLITGTPGRVIDLYKSRQLDLSKVDVLVFDEADRMFDMGFINDMHFLLSKVNPQRQILLFSATMNFSVLNMIYEYGANPQEINVSRDQMTADKIQQLLYHVGDKEKAAALLAVFKKHAGENGTAVVFVNYKERVPWVAAFLTKNGIPAQGLSSLLRQEKRNKIIQGFKGGQYRALVATDVASRGLDVDNVSLVVNYHLPEEAATYVHRIGRTARAGRDGIAVAICGAEDAYNQMRVEEFLGTKIPVEWLTEEEMPKDVKFPRRDEEDRDDEIEEGEGASARGGRGDRGDRGGRGRGGDRGPRGGRDRGPREPRAPREGQPERAPQVAAEGMDDASTPVAAEAPLGKPIPREPREPRAPREPRVPRESRGPREPREAREPSAEDTQAGPAIAAAADAEGFDMGAPEAGADAPAREGREDRFREPRREGGRDRGGRGRGEGRGDRGPRGEGRGDRGGREGGREARGGDRSRGGREREGYEESRKAPADMPNPLVGNPVIYDMATGKPKNRSPEEFKKFTDQYDSRLRNNEEKFQATGKKKRAPAIIGKISSKVTALFGKNKENKPTT